jgi:hypothetical protein
VESIKLLLPIGEAKYFCKEGWTAKLQNSLPGKSGREVGASRHDNEPRPAVGDVSHPALSLPCHANRVLGLIMDHYNDAALTLIEHPERYRPLFPIDRRNGEVIWEIWIEGFALAVDLRPAAWQRLLDAEPDPAAAILGMLAIWTKRLSLRP